jgi:hypothetical protein
MKAESDPVTDDEWLLRCVFFKRFRTDELPIISPNTFEPRDKKSRQPDTDGISLYRAACLADVSEILAPIAEDKRALTGIVRIPVALLQTLGLSVKIKPDVVRGHVVIPELREELYFADKAKFTPIKLALAVEASKDENIVRWPTASLPDTSPSS